VSKLSLPKDPVPEVVEEPAGVPTVGPAGPATVDEPVADPAVDPATDDSGEATETEEPAEGDG